MVSNNTAPLARLLRPDPARTISEDEPCSRSLRTLPLLAQIDRLVDRPHAGERTEANLVGRITLKLNRKRLGKRYGRVGRHYSTSSARRWCQEPLPPGLLAHRCYVDSLTLVEGSTFVRMR